MAKPRPKKMTPSEWEEPAVPAQFPQPAAPPAPAVLPQAPAVQQPLKDDIVPEEDGSARLQAMSAELERKSLAKKHAQRESQLIALNEGAAAAVIGAGKAKSKAVGFK